MSAGVAFYVVARDPLTYRVVDRQVPAALVGQSGEVLARFIELSAVTIGVEWGRHFGVPFPVFRIDWTGEARALDGVGQ